MQGQIDNASWTPVENLHCTLSFLGAVEDARVSAISRSIASSVADLIDFPTHLGSLGAFPSQSRARVIWASLADEAGGIATLAGSVLEALVPHGFEPEHRRFRAHVTLARVRNPHRVQLDVRVEPVRFSVDRVILFESKLGRPHAVHTPLATFPFRRELAPPRPD